MIICNILGGEVLLYSPANGDVILSDCNIHPTSAHQSLNIAPQSIHVDDGNLQIGIIEGNSSINLLSPTTTTTVHSQIGSSKSNKVIGNTALGVVHYETLLHQGGIGEGTISDVNQIQPLKHENR